MMVMASASTGLSPEWDRWFDEAFTELITGDEDLLHAEFGDLIASSWPSPSSPPTPPASPRAESPADGSQGDPSEGNGQTSRAPESSSALPP